MLNKVFSFNKGWNSLITIPLNHSATQEIKIILRVNSITEIATPYRKTNRHFKKKHPVEDLQVENILHGTCSLYFSLPDLHIS